jgi:hypothetical protein
MWTSSALVSALLLPVALAGASEPNGISKPFVAAALRGTVVTGWENTPVGGAIVEERDKRWKKVLTSTVTDAEGRFDLPTAGEGMHYVLVRKLLAEPSPDGATEHVMPVMVKVKRKATRPLVIPLEVRGETFSASPRR